MIVLLGGDLVALAAPAIGILLMLTLALPTRAKYESFILDATGKYPT